ncbi:hypothetical protein PIB30_012683 [Stylosanthes scabra]|uniref:Uncharacterized protein n=1 Tax=Stylosanthes scabra TaxID=79078 RepID=A0ABU6Q619_9FABA|nr:hypothetical protein [Stylosanthes scabra]
MVIKVRVGSGFAGLLVCMLVFLCSCSCVANNEQEHDKKQKQCLWEWQTLRDAYNIYSSLFTTSVTQYWGLLKALANYAYTRLFPPNIDFRRGGGGVGDKEGEGEGEGAGEKVKEAVSKSFGTSKATVEDAAKSAADTLQMVKRTFSPSDTHHHTDNNNNNHKRNEL